MTPITPPNLDDWDWDRWRSSWDFPEDLTYLNHGSFGPAPRVVMEARRQWLDRLNSNPMHFLVRELESGFAKAEQRLARLLDCRPQDLVMVPNATTAMNIVARNLDLAPGDEVLLTDHEYGAVVRTWGQRCQETGARTVLATLPNPLEDIDQIVDSLFERVTPRTRLIVVSHVSSQPAAVLPVAEICQRARTMQIPICIDGPHAVAMRPISLRTIDCDFYAASCHKWLSAPIGTGFLYVRARHKQELKPVVTSWGKSLCGSDPSWKDEFQWPGTPDPSGSLSVTSAIDFLESVGLDAFRSQTHTLARYARARLEELAATTALVPDSIDAYGSMVTVPLPFVARDSAWPGSPHPLQRWLWDAHRIEVPVFEWHERLMLRVSCHLYNRPADIDRLVDALEEWRRNRPA